mgnify:CR=1 FL=1
MSNYTIQLDEKAAKAYIKAHFPNANEPDYLALSDELQQNIINAGLECGIDPENIEESYCGEWDDDKEFAQQMADNCGWNDEAGQWPKYCIDWEYAARELMYDYSEHKGHYFLNL